METPLKGPKPAPETSDSKYVRLSIAARKVGNYPSLCDQAITWPKTSNGAAVRGLRLA